MLLLRCWQWGEKIGRIEVEKRQAVMAEDFDKASLKKIQIDEIRLQIQKEIVDRNLLELNDVSCDLNTPF